ncbi:hypothetical protein N0V88_004929 [Collariella sp. IMI 366227]|nr:hypothetical protein N0V88_004929 [Collariella sp. IMI 366227]
MYARQTQKLEQQPWKTLTAETTRTKYQVDNVEGKANLLASRIDRLERESVIVPTVQTDAPMARTTFNVPEEGIALGSRHNLNRDPNDNTDYHPRGAGGGGGDPDGDDDSDPDSRDGNRRHNRNPQHPRNPRGHRESTYDSGFTGTARAEAVKIKRDDIGLFDPHHEDPNDLGVVQDGKTLIYTDVRCFADRVYTFLEDEATREEASRAILSFFQTLLAGSAVIWWNSDNYACKA